MNILSIILVQKNALIVLDIDHFKEVNDTYGHLSGNEVINFTSLSIYCFIQIKMIL